MMRTRPPPGMAFRMPGAVRTIPVLLAAGAIRPFPARRPVATCVIVLRPVMYGLGLCIPYRHRNESVYDK